MRQSAYVYSFGGSGIPAHVSDSEMLTFMLLSDVAPDTIRYYFPDREKAGEELAPGRKARITVGELSGFVGVVEKVSADKYTVVLRFQSLGNAQVTASIPVNFLKFEE